MFLARPTDGFLPLAHGALSLQELRRRILLRAHAAGWIGDETFERTRPVGDGGHAGAIPPQTELPEDPVELVQVIRELVTGRRR